jgi:hypothetical protein
MLHYDLIGMILICTARAATPGAEILRPPLPSLRRPPRIVVPIHCRLSADDMHSPALKNNWPGS